MGSAITENERTVTGMNEYIEREALLKFIENGINNPDRKEAFGYDAVEILEKVQYMPAADVAPVRHGRWIDGDPYCPICRKDKFRGLDAMYGQIGSQTTAQIAARGWIWRSKLWV